MASTDPLPDMQWVLNKLAGTLDANNNPKYDMAGAANVWAGKPQGAYDLLGALNQKAGNTTPNTYRELNGVCNQLAGTQNLEAPGALRVLAGYPED